MWPLELWFAWARSFLKSGIKTGFFLSRFCISCPVVRIHCWCTENKCKVSAHSTGKLQLKKSISTAAETPQSTATIWPSQKRSRRARRTLARRHRPKHRTRPLPKQNQRARRARRHQARRTRARRSRRRARRSRAARPRRKSPTRRGPRPRRPRPSRPSRASRRSTACPRRRSASPSSIRWYGRSSRRIRPRPAFVIQLVAPRRHRRRGT